MLCIVCHHHLICYLSLLHVIGLEFLCLLRYDGNIKRKNNIFLEKRLVILLDIDRFMGMNYLGKTTWIISFSSDMTVKICTEVSSK